MRPNTSTEKTPCLRNSGVASWRFNCRAKDRLPRPPALWPCSPLKWASAQYFGDFFFFEGVRRRRAQQAGYWKGVRRANADYGFAARAVGVRLLVAVDKQAQQTGEGRSEAPSKYGGLPGCVLALCRRERALARRREQAEGE